MPLFNDPAEFERVARYLRDTPVFRLASRYDLARLISMASLHTATPGQAICVPEPDPNGPTSPSFFILLSGDYTLDGVTRIGGPRDGLAGLRDVLLQQPRSISLTAVSAGTYLEVSGAQFLALVASSTPLRQNLVPLLDLSGAQTTYVSPNENDSRGSIIQFVTTIVDTPLSLLIELLAREIATSFSDHVLVLRACAPNQSPSPAPIPVQGNGLGALWYMFVDPNLPEVALAHAPGYDYVLLDGVPSSTVDTVVKIFFGHADDYMTAPAIGTPRVLQTVVVGLPPLPCSKELHYVNANPAKITHACDCRIRLDLVQLRALAQVWNAYMPLTPIDAPLAYEMGVWARALTDRRTGIALAGGGVWSMQSVYIIKELRKRGVPLDVITGASAGAMVGAYYSAYGVPGLDMLVERGDSGVLDLVIGLWIFNGCFAQAFFEHEFKDRDCLDNLHVDFRPNATNLTRGEGVAFVRGPLATAIRAAASAPPLLPPTFSAEQRFVDGAFSNNLAAQILPYFGANLTFGANTYPPSKRPHPAWVPNFFTRITSLGPINRMFDFTVALNLLANLTGKVESGYADVAYNAKVNFPLPFLQTSNFCLSSKMVEHAAQDPAVNVAVDEFTLRWEHARRRGGRTWTTYPSS